LEDRSKEPHNVEFSNYFGSMITNDARCTNEIKCSIGMVKAAFNKKAVSTSILDINLRKKLTKCCIWIIAL